MPNHRKANKKIISTWLDQEIIRQMDEAALQEGSNRSDLMQAAVFHYLRMRGMEVGPVQPRSAREVSPEAPKNGDSSVELDVTLL